MELHDFVKACPVCGEPQYPIIGKLVKIVAGKVMHRYRCTVLKRHPNRRPFEWQAAA